MATGNWKETESASIDLHGLPVEEAEMQLIEYIDALPKTVRAVQVTHGYRHGVALKRMVKNDFFHWRVAGKRADLNAGVTWLLLK